MIYKSNLNSLDNRLTPSWYDEAKLGIFVHWGIYSVPAYAPRRKDVERTGLSYAEWYGKQVHDKYAPYYDFHRHVYGENDYKNFAVQWKAELFNPSEWMKLFHYAGAKYIILTSKHHDGFCLWPSIYSEYWNSTSLGPHRDIVDEVLTAADEYGIRRGLYYSLLEWFHSSMNAENAKDSDISKYAINKMIPQLKELVEAYKPDILFGDGEWDYSADLWHSAEFIAWLYNNSSVKDNIVINDRWGKECRGKHGSYFSMEYGEKPDNLSPEEFDALFINSKWEECRSIGASFGYNRNERLEDYLSENEIIRLLVQTVANGGNLCLNVGPCADGTISPLIEERLTQIGDWMKINSEAIYSTRPLYGLPKGFSGTRKGENYYIFMDKYDFSPLVLESKIFPDKFDVKMLGLNENLEYQVKDGKLIIFPSRIPVSEMPCKCMFTFKIGGIQ